MSEPPDIRRMSRDGALDVLARRRTNQVVMATMTARGPWEERSPSDRNLRCVGFMGGASTFGLGVALARPDLPVWIMDGDGSLLMQLGSLTTIAGAAPQRLLHLVFRNGTYETSGGQPIPADDTLSFAGMAREAGYRHAVRFDDVEAFDAAFDELLSLEGPVFVELITQPAGSFYATPPPPLEPPTPDLALNWPPVRDALRRDPPPGNPPPGDTPGA